MAQAHEHVDEDDEQQAHHERHEPRRPAREFLALRDGAADLAVGSTLLWSVQVVELNAIGLPWLAPEEKDLAKLSSEAVTERLAAAMERAGVVALAFAVLGHRELATAGKVPRSPEDMAGPFKADHYRY